ncbi:MAG: hypothetical protein ACKVWV_03305 [Planctomycetota bacterium]
MKVLGSLTCTLLAPCIFVSPACAQCIDWTNAQQTPGVAGSAPPQIDSFAVFDNGSGPELYAAGGFLHAGTTSVNKLARWSGTSWSAVSAGVPAPDPTWFRVQALFASGTELYLAGVGADDFLFPPAGFVSRIQQGGAASLVPGRLYLVDEDEAAEMHAFAMFDGGSGPRLHVGGRFRGTETTTVNSIARRDGDAWMSLGQGVEVVPDGGFTLAARVYALEPFDDGSGVQLYAGGTFNYAGGVLRPKIARWSGSAWSSVGIPDGMTSCRAFAVHDDGSGRALYAAGTQTSGGIVARWNGVAWSTVGATNGPVLALEVFDDGTGATLYASGAFATIAGVGANNVAKWNGSSWSALGAGLIGSATVTALESYDDGLGFGTALYAGGQFSGAGGDAALNFAAWRRCNLAGNSYCFGDGSLATACPCAPPYTVPNPSGAPGHGCANSFELGGARLFASGTTNPDSVRLRGEEQTPGGYSMFIVGTANVSSGIAVADGVRCAGGALVRFGAQHAIGGTIVYPNHLLGFTLSLSTLSGVTPGSGATRYYQALYRDATPGHCSAGTYNFTSGVEIVW